MSARLVNRRQLLTGAGAMIVGFSLVDVRLSAAQEQKLPAIPDNPAFDGPAQIELTPDLDSWIAIDADGGITFLTGRVEIGNGILTALQQIIADELSVSFDAIRLVSGDTDIVPNQGITSATTTIGVAANVIRVAAATARNALLDLATTELEADRAELEIADGEVSVSGDPSRSLAYADLVGGKLFDLKVDPDAELKPVEDYTIIGTPVPRTDIPRKLSAAKGDFVENSRVAGMKFARILRAPAYGAKLLTYDESVASQPGIVAVLPFRHPGDERLDRVERLETMPGDFIAVVADREDLAIAAVDKLRKTAEWDAPETLPATSDDIYDWLTANGKPIGLQEDHAAIQAEFDAAVKAADQTLEATYSGPYLHYGPISSAWSLADVRGDHATVWSASQWPFGARWMAAQALGYETSEQVQVFGGSSSGLYGRRDDYDQEADVESAILSQAVGMPVRLQWSRGEEFVWSQYRPPQVVKLRAGLDAEGSITGLSGDIWTAVRGVHPDPTIAAMALMDTPYAVGPLSIEGFDAGPVLRTGYMRNVYSGYNIFALESFMDEAAYSAKIDPVEFRLNHLSDERAADVIRAATEQAGWSSHTEPSGAGIGVSFVLYHKSDGPAATYLAYVAEVAVDEASGAVRVKKMTCALDCGLVVNPDGVKNQVEGGVIQATSWALKEQVTFDRSIVTSHDWATYPILTFPEVPEIDVVIVNRPDQPWKGIGEPVTVPVASAIANAVFDATGARVRQLPMNPDRVKAVIDAL
jgi:nicotinate dehydrogenase subunit B